jgi:PPP family 3-phenylpropionic acid transporter
MQIAVFYFLLFLAQGIIIPYLPPYFCALGFSGEQLSTIAALAPLLMIVAPPCWGFMADHTGKPAMVLKLVAAGAALAFMPMLRAKSFYAVAVAFAVYAVFATAVQSLTDTIAVAEAKRLGTHYGRLRLWGSIGFIVSSLGFSQLLGAGLPRHYTVTFAAGALLLYAAFAQSLRPAEAPSAPRTPALADIRRLLAQPPLLAFLMAATIHWTAMQSYYFLYAIHLERLHVAPQYIGWGLTLGVCAEITVMWKFRSLLRRVPLFALLTIAFLGSSLRWYVVSIAVSGPVLAFVQVFHGLSFGVFYVGSLGHLDQAVPEQQRATGWALFVSVVFGVGGILGNKLSGYMLDHGGAAAGFQVSSMLELLAPLPLLLAFWLQRAAPAPEPEPLPRAGDSLSA